MGLVAPGWQGVGYAAFEVGWRPRRWCWAEARLSRMVGTPLQLQALQQLAVLQLRQSWVGLGCLHALQLSLARR